MAQAIPRLTDSRRFSPSNKPLIVPDVRASPAPTVSVTTVDMEDKSPQSPKAFFMSTSYWGEYFERYGIAKRTGKSEIVGIFKNNVANEYLFDLSMMTPIENINEKISFLNVPIIFPKKDSKQSGVRNRWGLTESQTKEALQGVRHSDEVEEAIEWYKIDHNIS